MGPPGAVAPRPFKSGRAVAPSMAAMPPDGPDDAMAPAPGGTAAVAQHQTRYTYLVGRLRSRQITMEEATELFGAMQGMLRTSETARRALLAASRATLPAGGMAPREVPAPPRVASGSDDMLLLGLLTMGAGAGLLAAMARRMAEPGSAPRTERSSRSSS